MTKHSLTKKEFREVWEPVIVVTQISDDPYRFRAEAHIDYYGENKSVSAFGETANDARRRAFDKLQDNICGTE